jgi:hypothetical protein
MSFCKLPLLPLKVVYDGKLTYLGGFAKFTLILVCLKRGTL